MAITSLDNYRTSREYISLSHLLARLRTHILSSSADLKPLRQSKYHRARVAANIEYGRTLLLQLEQSLPSIKSPARKHALQTDLAEQRLLLKSLKQRLEELAIEAETSPQEDDFSSEDEEDILATPAESTPGDASPRRTSGSQGEAESTGGEISQAVPEAQEAESDRTDLASMTPPSTSSEDPYEPGTLRSRRTPHPAPPSHTTTASAAATTTGTSHPTAKLSAPKTTPTTTTTPLPSAPTPTSAPSKTQTTESTLTQSRHEQDTLTDSLLSLATQLKASSHTFHASLESEKSILTRAVEGLDRNTENLDAASKRMGMLRRMTEGKGWWGRVLMYMWIFGLWVAAILIVFVGPKLRF